MKDKINNPTAENVGLFPFYMLQNFPYIEETFDAVTYYEMLCKVVEYLNIVIKNLNSTEEDVRYIYEAFTQLQDYVKHYFDNLDVQTEINNKLDQMVLDGTLAKLIIEYLKINSILSFDTVKDMKESKNLILGTTCKTLGFYKINDGGAAFYKVTNSDLEDNNGKIIKLNNGLTAELIIDDSLNVMQFGAYGDNVHDDSEGFQNMINQVGKLISKNKNFTITNSIILENNDINCDSYINYTGNDYLFKAHNLHNRHIHLRAVDSANGGLFELKPNVGEQISFCEFYIGYVVCNKEILMCDGTNGPITTSNFNGIRWGSNTNAVKLFIDSKTENNSFISELNFYNMELWSNPHHGVLALNKNLTTNEIQYNLISVNLEGCGGIQNDGCVSLTNLTNCRLAEVTYKYGFITIKNYPSQIYINGAGRLLTKNIVFENVESNDPLIHTNMGFQDTVNDFPYNGGCEITKNYPIPKNPAFLFKLIDFNQTDNVSIMPTLAGNINRYLGVVGTGSNKTIKLTNNINLIPYIFANITQTIDIKFQTENFSTTIHFEEGSYIVLNYGGEKFKAIKLN